ncbi:hypothetical protein [Asticcacaulis sp. YBE204]|uniref:hypothetical protein n=1 Tax=Asticcacaulis sp. YBE204 TaxID=1282363 RepID=UPI0003C3C999|nr:hypothetical protein [Asticcacaulis sp. YBE204]ESQ78936.1 hypothetical protein AEYBE204_10965 [Asticcacaulis sp. YBE204]
MTDTLKPDLWRKTWRLVLWGGAGALLLLPLVAMQFTTEVAWTGSDFAVFGAMLLCALGAFELAVRLSGHWAYRAAAGLAILTGFALVWVSLAVGIIGAEDNPANLIFAAVLGVGLIGTLIVRFQARRMVWVLMSMALVQGVGAVIALSDGYPATILTAMFGVSWLVSAGLFHKAANATEKAS